MKIFQNLRITDLYHSIQQRSKRILQWSNLRRFLQVLQICDGSCRFVTLTMTSGSFFTDVPRGRFDVHGPQSPSPQRPPHCLSEACNRIPIVPEIRELRASQYRYKHDPVYTRAKITFSAIPKRPYLRQFWSDLNSVKCSGKRICRSGKT